MKKTYLLFLLFCFGYSFGQVVINEVDPDTVSTDDKEFIELKSVTPNFLLDGYVLVFYNATASGLGTTSYFSLSLDGYATDANGNIHIGNSFVSPSPKIIIPNNTIQNGPDVVSLYLGSDADFPFGTTATPTNLVDALAYSSSNAFTATALMSILGITQTTNETLNSAAATQSIQRKSDGTYEVKTPTPGVNNDGTGIVFNYINVATNFTTLPEGNNLVITCTTTQTVATTPLVLNFTLNNGTFNASDYSGNLTMTIPVGSTTANAVIQILNDGVNEGDEDFIIKFTSPLEYSLNRNNIVIRATDANFVSLPFGSPANPTHGMVTTTAPIGYYASLEGLSGAALKQALQDIIANPSLVHGQNYGDVYDILKQADQNPENSSQVWLIYNETPKSKLDIQTGNSIVGKWNREHIYCQSRGGFADATSNVPDGIDIWEPAGPNIIATGHGDAHHIRAVDGQENSSRNNRNYGVDYNGPSGNPGTWHGDVARALFYMAVRYNGLQIINGNPADAPVGYIGDLTTLLSWNLADTSDDFEMNRNNIIYTWQKNRNPFIDMPKLANYIFGANYGQPWFETLATTNFQESKVSIYPNPAQNVLNVSGITEDSKIDIYNMTGAKVLSTNCSENKSIPLDFAAGIYSVRITSENNSTVKRLIIQ